MNTSILRIRQHRSELLGKISDQRERLAESVRQLDKPIKFADRMGAAVRFLIAHPMIAGTGVAILVSRRHGMYGLFRGTWRFWKSYRYISTLASSFLPKA